MVEGENGLMAIKKPDMKRDELNALAERAQDFAIEVSLSSERVSMMTDYDLEQSAQKFNMLAEAVAQMNRMLLARLYRKAHLESERKRSFKQAQ